jgi:hypothetical protein
VNLRIATNRLSFDNVPDPSPVDCPDLEVLHYLGNEVKVLKHQRQWQNVGFVTVIRGLAGLETDE